MAPKKNKHEQIGGDWKDTALDVAKTVGSTALDFAPYLPLLIGLGKKVKNMEEQLLKKQQTNQHESDIVVDPKPTKQTKPKITKSDFDVDAYNNSVNLKRVNNAQYQGGKYIIAGNQTIDKSYSVGGYQKVGGKPKGSSPLFQVLHDMK